MKLATYRMFCFYGQSLRCTGNLEESITMFREALTYLSTKSDLTMEHEVRMQIAAAHATRRIKELGLGCLINSYKRMEYLSQDMISKIKQSSGPNLKSISNERHSPKSIGRTCKTKLQISSETTSPKTNLKCNTDAHKVNPKAKSANDLLICNPSERRVLKTSQPSATSHRLIPSNTDRNPDVSQKNQCDSISTKVSCRPTNTTTENEKPESDKPVGKTKVRSSRPNKNIRLRPEIEPSQPKPRTTRSTRRPVT